MGTLGSEMILPSLLATIDLFVIVVLAGRHLRASRVAPALIGTGPIGDLRISERKFEQQ